MNIPPVMKKILLPLGVLVFFAVTWYGLYRPEMRKIAEYRNSPLATRQQIDQMTRQLSAYQEPTDREKAEWARLELEIQQKIPRGKEITSLFASLSELAEKYHLADFQRRLIADQAAQAAPIEDGGVPRMSFKLELGFQSGYGDLIGFLGAVRSLERLVEITGLEINRGIPNLTVTLNLDCYYTPEP